ncbi:MAG: DUF4185 domain-containing protein [Gammaproteobacteria bacterium]|nr:DUF4185 domain-containing protein [Gammaproteobacteria bacterium]NNL50549.1 DUF4185 domain-containing protein [Woeseiaceae bacterium]
MQAAAALQPMRILSNALAISIGLGGVPAHSTDDVPCFEASEWLAADSLFFGDPHWVGADGAYSIDLGHDRTLWLFGDTWVDPSGRHTRQNAHMIRNSVAIQTGADPSNATIKFYWQADASDVPKAFFAQQGGEWFWPGHGVRLDDRLIIFLNRLRGTSTGLGFASAGWNAVMIENPDDEPSNWRKRMLQTPENPLGIIVGFASTMRWKEYLYAFGSEDPVKTHPIYVARWPVAKVHEGDLESPEWWGGVEIGWVPDASSASRRPVIENGQSELTVHASDGDHKFIAVQTVGFGKSDLAIRSAKELTGPWTPPNLIYRPPEYDRPNVMIYSAKAHPQLAGADLVVTYSTNTFKFQEHLTDSRIYYPRFVRLERCN